MKAARILAFFGCIAVASATSVTFTFDTQVINGTTITGLSSGATSSTIASYMNQVLAAAGCSTCSVTVYDNTASKGSGTGSIGAVVDQQYNGENHVVGPNAKSETLGTSDYATSNSDSSAMHPSGTYDSFLANTKDGSGAYSQAITLQFSGFTGLGLTIKSFDYEVFPDGTCSALTSYKCGGSPTGGIYPNQPDLIFNAGNGTNGTGDANVFTQYGYTPVSSGGSDGTSTHSPLSGTGTAEKSPQYIGTWSGSINNATELDFIDWPATIGIDNLQITWTPPSGPTVPEPGSILLFGSILTGLALRKKIRKTA